jgi:two-component system sensor histidine kinase UhpB
LTQSGQVIGAFSLYFQDTGSLTEDIIQLLSSLAADISFTLDFIAESQQREQMQNELHDLSVFLQSALENERKRIARELHDELGQTMTALHFDLKWLQENSSAQGREVHNKLLSMQALVARTVDTTRRISEDLRPGMLDDLGLAAAIEHHTAKFAAQTGIACDLAMSHADFDLDDRVATALFRIVQESLTNVARHSGARHASVRLRDLGDKMLLIVQDDGRGLPTSLDAGKKTFGLLGMRERVKMLEGTLDVFNEAGAGARIEACIPKYVRHRRN